MNAQRFSSTRGHRGWGCLRCHAVHSLSSAQRPALPPATAPHPSSVRQSLRCPSSKHQDHDRPVSSRRRHTLQPPRAASFAAAAPSPISPKLSALDDDHEAHGELHSLNVAIIANILIFAAKVYVHLLTGSSSMLSEALHSIADVGNQALLRVGVLQSARAPTPLHPYGYTRDRFVWSLISAVGIFFLGAGASFIHGIHTLFDSRVLQPTVWTYAVLGVSLVLEGYSLWVATCSMWANAKARGLGLIEYIRSGANPTTLAVMLEDGGAVVGLLIAGACSALADLTGNAMFDAGGSILVGCLLGAIATYLVQYNRQVLIGRSMKHTEISAVLDLLQRDPVVAQVLETKTEEVGPSVFRFKAEVAWNGDSVVQRYVERCGRERLICELRTALDSTDARAIDNVLKDYGRDIISSVGSEVDRLESQIQKMNPGIKWVDLETDRGRTTYLHMHLTRRHTPAAALATHSASTQAPRAFSPTLNPLDGDICNLPHIQADELGEGIASMYAGIPEACEPSVASAAITTAVANRNGVYASAVAEGKGLMYASASESASVASSATLVTATADVGGNGLHAHGVHANGVHANGVAGAVLSGRR